MENKQETLESMMDDFQKYTKEHLLQNALNETEEHKECIMYHKAKMKHFRVDGNFYDLDETNRIPEFEKKLKESRRNLRLIKNISSLNKDDISKYINEQKDEDKRIDLSKSILVTAIDYIAIKILDEDRYFTKDQEATSKKAIEKMLCQTQKTIKMLVNLSDQKDWKTDGLRKSIDKIKDFSYELNKRDSDHYELFQEIHKITDGLY